MLNFWNKILFVFLVLIIYPHNSSEAYIGLGPLVPVLGSIVMYIFIGIITFLGIILYPLRLLQKKFKKKKK